MPCGFAAHPWRRQLAGLAVAINRRPVSQSLVDGPAAGSKDDAGGLNDAEEAFRVWD